LWRDQRKLDLPSFYLELTAIKALQGAPLGALAQSVWTVFQYFRDSFVGSRVVDPANSNNIISGDLTVVDQLKVKAAAMETVKAQYWSQVIK
jgi:hypothetical protein